MRGVFVSYVDLRSGVSDDIPGTSHVMIVLIGIVRRGDNSGRTAKYSSASCNDEHIITQQHKQAAKLAALRNCIEDNTWLQMVGW